MVHACRAPQSVQWLQRVHPNLTRRELPYDCTIEPGDLLYVPNNFIHGVLNLGETVAVAVTS